VVTDEAPSPASRRVQCPTWGEMTSWLGNPERPFCSLTCRLIDLGGWLDERYRIPARGNKEGGGGTDVP